MLFISWKPSIKMIGVVVVMVNVFSTGPLKLSGTELFRATTKESWLGTDADATMGNAASEANVAENALSYPDGDEQLIPQECRANQREGEISEGDTVRGVAQ